MPSIPLAESCLSFIPSVWWCTSSNSFLWKTAWTISCFDSLVWLRMSQFYPYPQMKHYVSIGIRLEVIVPFILQHCMVPFNFNPWTVACQAPQSTEFPRWKYWSGLSFSSPRDLSYPGIEPASLTLQADSLLLSHQRSPLLASTEAVEKVKCQLCPTLRSHGL